MTGNIVHAFPNSRNCFMRNRNLICQKNLVAWKTYWQFSFRLYNWNMPELGTDFEPCNDLSCTSSISYLHAETTHWIHAPIILILISPPWQIGRVSLFLWPGQLDSIEGLEGYSQDPVAQTWNCCCDTLHCPWNI